jgi:hypothetical protein
MKVNRKLLRLCIDQLEAYLKKENATDALAQLSKVKSKPSPESTL